MLSLMVAFSLDDAVIVTAVREITTTTTTFQLKQQLAIELILNYSGPPTSKKSKLIFKYYAEIYRFKSQQIFYSLRK